MNGSTTQAPRLKGTSATEDKCQLANEQCEQLCDQTNVWLSNNRDSESTVFRISRSVMTILSQMRCFTTLTQNSFITSKQHQSHGPCGLNKTGDVPEFQVTNRLIYNHRKSRKPRRHNVVTIKRALSA